MRFSQSLGTSGLAGAVRFELTARGFGVDVETKHKERGRGSVARFLPQDQKQVVLIWCYPGKIGTKTAGESGKP